MLKHYMLYTSKLFYCVSSFSKYVDDFAGFGGDFRIVLNHVRGNFWKNLITPQDTKYRRI